MKKLITGLLLAVFMLLPGLVFAENQASPSTAVPSQQNVGPGVEAVDLGGITVDSNGQVVMPKIDEKDLTKRFAKKFINLILMLQKMSWYVAVVFIIFGFFMMMFSIFYLKMAWIGIVVIMIEIVAYTGIMYSPLLLQYSYSWLAS